MKGTKKWKFAKLNADNDKNKLKKRKNESCADSAMMNQLLFFKETFPNTLGNFTR